jgi:hypothetical protein
VVVGTFRHGASPTDAPGTVRDVNPPDFWRSVVVEEMPATPGSGEQWLDPTRTISEGWALYARAQRDPTQANLDLVASRRPQIKAWLEGISRTLAPEGAELTQRNLSDYRRIYASAEQLWAKTDELLALQRHSAAAAYTHQAWATGTCSPDRSRSVLPGRSGASQGTPVIGRCSRAAAFPHACPLPVTTWSRSRDRCSVTVW